MPSAYPLYQVDAFAEGVFSGNPAAVVPLTAWLPNETLAAIAAENNLSETAFFLPLPGGEGYHLRWFTPTFEIDLCGHATLAAAFVLFTELGHTGNTIRFATLSGDVFVERKGELLTLDFPAWPAKPIAVTDSMAHALGTRPVEAHVGRDLLAIYPDEATIHNLRPNPTLLLTMPYVCIICSAPGTKHDVVCRVFSPEIGIMEDPVTGSAQCTLAPYWAARLGVDTLTCHQASKRGGLLRSQLVDDRVRISGTAALYLRGTIYL